MPAYYGKWQEMPETLEDLAELMMGAYGDGIKEGRQQGAQEMVDIVDDFLKRRYFSPQVIRGSKFGDDILELVRDLIHDLRHGDLGKIPEFKERKNPSKQKGRPVNDL